MNKFLALGLSAFVALAPVTASAQEAVQPIDTTKSSQLLDLRDGRTGLIVAGATALLAIAIIAGGDDSDGPVSTVRQ